MRRYGMTASARAISLLLAVVLAILLAAALIFVCGMSVALAQPPDVVLTSSTSTTADAEWTRSTERRTGVGHTATVSIGRPIEVDPTNRSSCTLETAEQGRQITLNLEGMRWSKWPNFCERLIKYLRPDTSPFEPELAKDSQRLLAETGYFAAVTCTATISTSELACSMTPQPMVQRVDVGGNLPFVLLDEDIRRQVFLRPGSPVYDERDSAEKQERRIEDYLTRTGFFDSNAKVTITPSSGGAEPNEGLRVGAEVVFAGDSGNLGRVNIDGDPGVPPEEIDDILRHYWLFAIFPRRFQPERFEEDLEYLTNYLQGRGWPEAYINGEYHLHRDTGKVDVILHMQIGPKLVLKFEGNRAFDDDKLRELATFRKAGSADPVEIENTVDAIRQHYQGDGYYRVKVESRVENNGSGDGNGAQEKAHPKKSFTKTVVFTIEEGPRAEITRFAITGNKIISGDDLMSEIKMRTKASGFLHTGRWMDRNVGRDERAIRRFYRDRGFADVRVESTVNEFAPGQLDVAFIIDEGEQRTVGSLAIKGLPEAVKEEDVVKRLKLVKGAPFVEDELPADRREILTQLAARGHPKAVVNRKMKLPFEAGGQVTLEYEVEPGQHQVFGGFLVRGNFRTSESVIGYELGLDPGQTLDLVTLSEAEQRLRALGVFSSVNLRPLDQWLGGRETWYAIDVAERDQRTLDVVGSFATDTGFSVGLDFKDPNFFGRAIHFDVSTRLSNASELAIHDARIGNIDLIRARAEAPHPLGLPFNMDYSAFYQLERNADLFERKLGATTGISRVLIPSTLCGACPEVTGRFGYELSAVAGTITPQLDVSPVPIARLVPSIAHKRLDNPVDPRLGFAGDLRFELANHYFAGPIRDAPNFWRFLASEQGYLTLFTPFFEEVSQTMRVGGPLVAAADVQFGIARPYAEGNVPFTESMFYGGDLRVRGLRERASLEVFPGSQYLFTSSMELRWYFLQASFGAFQIAPLMDLGTVSVRSGELFQKTTVTAGAAVRWITPVGPLSLAYARPVKLPPELAARPDLAPNWRLHIYFGYSF